MRKMKLYKDRDWLYQKYIIEKLSTPEIGKICRVVNRTILNQLNKFGIKTRNIIESKRVKKMSPFFIKRIGKKNSMWGKHHSKEAKEKISKASKGNKHLLGHKHTKETKMKMKESHLSFTGENNPFWGKYHSEETKRKMSESSKGEKHPCWLGGISFEPYGIEFNKELKAFIRERDNYCCQECGIKENGKAHDCHHIDYNKKNNEDWNFVTLCDSCHPKTNVNREYWENYFKEKRA